MTHRSAIYLSLSFLLAAAGCSTTSSDDTTETSSEASTSDSSGDADAGDGDSGDGDTDSGDGDSGDGDSGDGDSGDGDSGDGDSGDGDSGDGDSGDGDSGDGDSGDGDSGDGDSGDGDSGDGDGDGDGDTGGGQASCMGTPTMAQQDTCSALSSGMECNPALGCRDSGMCEAKLSQNECLLRSLAECGSGAGTGVCEVQLADPIENSLCVQTPSAASCNDNPALALQGSCLNHMGKNGIMGVCEWNNGGNPTCQAMNCEEAPVEQFCNFIDGCSWTTG